ncbi:mechanosensitive ion channel family protein [Thermus tengchongensis]|uniref:Mechanosensitive ion channel family protein n=1 Tax=Thermus tengchongensis TaxID=1214928 RepID=A0ABY2K4W6_9DEIN|nr:mechanosensitive ion channel family protein [Thermus tengchongensis]TFU15414.1 mechanosensitive ion channel family protein [Thermus tengchongensis]
MVALHVALALLLAWLLGRYGARALSALGRLTPTEQDDRFFRALGFLWWGVVALLALSYLAHALAWPLEPLATWGKALAQWLGSRGLAALAVVGLTFLGYRLIPLLLARLPEPEGELTREVVRRKTLRAVADSVLKVAILTLGGLFLLSNLGFNVTALLAGAGVAGLAISFAAQNLIRDFINGFFILLEDQYGVGDIVQIGSVGGVVERFNLRLTVLRDLEGRVHFIPNSEVRQVTVLTQEWSRAVVDVGVAYKEDLDRVLAVFRDEVERFYGDPEWRERFTDAPEVLGVQDLGQSAVLIRVLFNTKPAQQWAVAREFRRRIKNRLDREGIEIPYPHQKLYFGEPLRLEKGA